MKISQSREPRAVSQIREFIPSSKSAKQGACAHLSRQIESPVSHAFSQLSFALLPVDKPQESRDSPMLSGKATFREEAQIEPLRSLHVKGVPHPSLVSKQEAQHKLLKQCQAIWMATDGQSQADTASSESRRGSPHLMPSQPPQGKHSTPLSTGFHSIETSPSFSQRSPKPVQLSLTSALKLSGGSNHVRQKGASLVTMLLGQGKSHGNGNGATPSVQLTPPKQSLPEEKLRQFAQIVADDFHKNVGVPSQPRNLSLQRELPREMSQSNYLGAPAFAMLGYSGGNQAPLRSKAFSMQLQDQTLRSEEKRTAPLNQGRLGSPQISPCKRSHIRSLLLEPDDDMEDLALIWPQTTDLNELNGPDEDEHDEGTSETETNAESRESFFTESIFCSGALSAPLLTQAD